MTAIFVAPMVFGSACTRASSAAAARDLLKHVERHVDRALVRSSACSAGTAVSLAISRRYSQAAIFASGVAGVFRNCKQLRLALGAPGRVVPARADVVAELPQRRGLDAAVVGGDLLQDLVEGLGAARAPAPARTGPARRRRLRRAAERARRPSRPSRSGRRQRQASRFRSGGFACVHLASRRNLVRASDTRATAAARPRGRR